MTAIFQKQVPYDTSRSRLPGVKGFKLSEWLTRDEAFAEQIALREVLLRTRRDEVLAVTDAGREAADELMHYVLDWLATHDPGYRVTSNSVIRPDGKAVTIDPRDPLGTLGVLVQEDLCLLDTESNEHKLVAAVVCFPANWRLAEKIGRPLIGIHDPVPEYDATLAKRVQRLFDAVEIDQPIWRFNALDYYHPDLFQPERRENDYAHTDERATYPYFRSERQCILRLPQTRACVFSIHTFVLEKSKR